MKSLRNIFLVALTANTFAGCAQPNDKTKITMDSTNKNKTSNIQPPTSNNLDTATFGAGCFWCVEAQFLMLKGVISVTSGYSGGKTTNPTYKEVCNGTTGHAEVCQVVFDSTKITFDELLEAFWQTHDPTQLNRQGNDLGTQYRSVIFYHNDTQKQLAEEYKDALNKSGAWDKPIVTEISAFSKFYAAEDYHNNYYAQNSEESYCQYVIQPKVEKFKKVFKDKIKH